MNPRKNLDQLLISKVRIKAIKYFISNPDEPIHLRGAVRELNEEINAVRRELSRLEEIKLLYSEKKGNRKYFGVNKDFLYFDELRSMVFKTFGLGGEIVKAKNKLGDVSFVALTEQYVEANSTEGLDLVVVGDGVSMELLDQIVTKQEERDGRHINYTVLSTRDFELHKRRRDTFILQILTHGRVMLIGSEKEFISE